MVYRICGGIGLLLLALSMAVGGIPSVVVAVFLGIAGVALLAGL